MSKEILLRKQFDVLTYLERSNGAKTQRDIAEATAMSVGSVNRTVAALTDLGYVDGYVLTEAGYAALEPYRARRAIFLAAGFSSRLAPVTLNTPKPLVRVNGKRIIDGLIDAVLAAGIEEIIIVRGYLAEQFDQLLYKYPMIRFLENPVYNETNNIASAICARYLFSNAYVFEADLLLSNPSIIQKYQFTSNFLGIKKERTDDWCFSVTNGVITQQKVGGLNCYQEVGISYWNEADGKKLSQHLVEAYNLPGGKEFYWDQIPFIVFPKEYAVEIRECQGEDVLEIDTYRELKNIDKAYDL